jgi:hypothetical protein
MYFNPALKVIAVQPSKFSGPDGDYLAPDITVGNAYEVVSTDKFVFEDNRFSELVGSVPEEYLLVDDSGRTSWHNAKYFKTISEYRDDIINKILI